MILPRKKDTIHKAQMYQLLMHLVDDKRLSRCLYFKGGTAAAMLSWLDRFSIDLDFDLAGKVDMKMIEGDLEKIFLKLNLEVKDKSKKVLQYFLKYKSKARDRNTLKLEVLPSASKKNDYQSIYFSEIDRYIQCQTKETMVANKLVALTDRYKQHKTIAGRDVYDIYYFLVNGYGYKKEIIEDRTKIKTKEYFKKLIRFIDKKITDKVINQDLNFLLVNKRFQAIRKTLKNEVLILLNDEVRRLK